MRAMTASTVDAVSNRIERAIADDASQAKGLSFDGTSHRSDVLLAHGQSLESGTFDFDRLLAGASFTLPLNATAQPGRSVQYRIVGADEYGNPARPAGGWRLQPRHHAARSNFNC